MLLFKPKFYIRSFSKHYNGLLLDVYIKNTKRGSIYFNAPNLTFQYSSFLYYKKGLMNLSDIGLMHKEGTLFISSKKQKIVIIEINCNTKIYNEICKYINNG
jgi:hypothetical protein